MGQPRERHLCLSCSWTGVVCGLCHHAAATSRHHLTPASQGGKITIGLCGPCHSKLHATFTNKELARGYHTLEQLFGHPEVCKFATWRHARPHAPVGGSAPTKGRRRHSRYA